MIPNRFVYNTRAASPKNGRAIEMSKEQTRGSQTRQYLNGTVGVLRCDYTSNPVVRKRCSRATVNINYTVRWETLAV